MAVKSPAAVVTRASEMPGATARRLAEPAAPKPEKASMMPQTVPNRPMNGVTEPVVASQVMPFSTRRISSADASCMLTVTAFRLFSAGGCGLPGAVPTWLCNSAGSAEDAQKLIALAANPPKQTQLLENHSPRDD